MTTLPAVLLVRTSYDDKSGASLTLIINFIPTKSPVCEGNSAIKRPVRP